ncbi:hypothetical protein [Alteromonas sp.]|uniref:hypothetical protein n=1 Tax=Alteromonas sp. TaxID=232 RepID=UPI000B7558A8|nr:hypothetical protein [Alteromonas sp.]OUX89887.1 MAG: hypothetical protein CBB95_05225 [Alteromonas sp. TMED35]|tara:strand:- start:23144 stop:23536 length:393 start_codon:yes stop_codon:yes gene_type:complete
MTVKTHFHASTSASTTAAINAKDENSERAMAIASYLEFTKILLPTMAKAANKLNTWPIQNDHCFQRVVLDTICQAPWYDVIPSPAYKNLSLEQARAAKALCEKIANNQVCLTTLNNKSKAWRNKQAKFDF